MRFVAIWVVTSLIIFIMIPCEPPFIPYVFFISSTKEFSLVLSSRYYEGLFSIYGRPMMNTINSMLMETGSSIHRNPPWRIYINFLIQLFTSLPFPKWGIFRRFRVHVFFRHIINFFGYMMGSPKGPMPTLSIYICCKNSENFSVSDTSWLAYLIFLTQPYNIGVAFTPYGMDGNIIRDLGCL
jgi:hypothetical protein